MPITYDVDERLNFLHVKASGCLTDAELLAVTTAGKCTGNSPGMDVSDWHGVCLMHDPEARLDRGLAPLILGGAAGTQITRVLTATVWQTTQFNR